MVIFALWSVTPVATYVGERNFDRITRFLIDLAPAPDEDTRPGDELGAGGLMVVVAAAAIGAAAFAAVMTLRRRATARIVERGGDVSSTLVHTIVAWLAALVAAAVGGTAFYVAGTEGMRNDYRAFAEQPAYMLLAIGGLLLAVAMSDHRNRLRHGLGKTVRRAAADRPDTGFVEGLRAFVRSALIGAALALASLADVYLGDSEGFDLGRFVAIALAGIVLLPGVFAVSVFIVLGSLAPTRWTIRDALDETGTKIALGLMLGGLALLGLELVGVGGADIVGNLMILVGVIVASITGLALQDVGPQPWLGFLVIGGAFAYGLSAEGGGQPTTIISWLITAVVAVLSLVEAKKLWREEHPLVPAMRSA